ncbi:glycine-tRNA ligase [Actinidia rufa]|uniref:glycine--tRNA ligase n=1 Tax=Actinidia rufa TaxID=165716 RepID=A0A7J0E5K2_9ERIC|nr:glycine-tRNA ligase [Actinidia rufa]
MAILSLPIVISLLKPHKTPLFFLFARAHNPNLLRKRYFAKTTVSAITTSSNPIYSSTNPEPSKKASVPTFQQAIQRLQEYWASVGCAVMQCSNTECGGNNGCGWAVVEVKGWWWYVMEHNGGRGEWWLSWLCYGGGGGVVNVELGWYWSQRWLMGGGIGVVVVAVLEGWWRVNGGRGVVGWRGWWQLCLKGGGRVNGGRGAVVVLEG